MKFFKKEERDPFAEEAFAQRLGALTNRTKGAADPYATQPGAGAIAA
jgi:hypothetical protein